MSEPERIVIAGGPRTGKTTLAHKLGLDRGVIPMHTDSLIGKLDWSAVSLEVSRWLDRPGPWIIEGVATPRALRKWLAHHATGKPCDRVYWLTTPKVACSPGQLTMAKGCLTVWNEILPMLERRGVDIVRVA